jgi:GcrA cell cycle regulator
MPQQLIEWNEQNVARLSLLWIRGVTASGIARIMGISKNAVISKRYRCRHLKDRRSKPVPPSLNYDPRKCVWPLGDPRKPDFHFCGAPLYSIMRPYCIEHERLAWKQSPKRSSASPMRKDAEPHI